MTTTAQPHERPPIPPKIYQATAEATLRAALIGEGFLPGTADAVARTLEERLDAEPTIGPMTAQAAIDYVAHTAEEILRDRGISRGLRTIVLASFQRGMATLHDYQPHFRPVRRNRMAARRKRRSLRR